jgi:hypothetical protein
VTRLRALGAAALVAVVVFYALAAPLLQSWLGPWVVVPAYVAVALLAGAVTYRAVLVLSRLADRGDGDDDLDGDVGAGDLAELVGGGVEEGDVEAVAAGGDLDGEDVEAVAAGGDLDREDVEAVLGDAETEREG